ncbi:family 10 glycosylhydrolase [Synechocystis sp. LKSZ1]|uniref:family 10 glycosylhydrolase n=1 Tax=Synechocystis sp. LKSZ1 TaxID=3144951 RepID=UPI00336C101B
MIPFPWRSLRLSRWWVWVLVALASLGLTLGWQLQTPTPARVAPVYGVWLTNVDSPVLYDSQQLAPALTVLGKAHFNTLYPTVWNGGHTLYPSPMAQTKLVQGQDPQLQGRDPLGELIPLARAEKMRVIPWLEFGFMAPADSELARRYPQWLTQRQDGSKIWLEGKVHERVWLNPLHSEVQAWMTDLALELLAKYPIDGLQVDDHWAYPADFGYDSLTLALYQKEHAGQAPPPAPALDPNQNCLVADPQWQEWVQWRADKMTQAFEQWVQALKARRPGLVISVSPNPQTFSKNCFLLDWQAWQEKTLVDELALQVYRSQLASFQAELQQPEVQATKAKIPVIVGILAGLKGRPVPLEPLQAQIQWAQRQGFAGVSFFFYESLWNFGPEAPETRQQALETWLQPQV